MIPAFARGTWLSWRPASDAVRHAPGRRLAVIPLCVLVLVATAVPLSAQAPAPAPILVLPFNNRSGDVNLDWIGESFVQAFADAFRLAGQPVLDQSERAAAFNQEGVPNLATLSQATLIQVAARANAGWLILGRFTAVGGQFSARASVFDLRRQHLVRVSARPGPLPQLETIEARLAWRVLRVIAPDTTVSEAQVLAQRQQVPLAAYERYIRALLATEPPVQHKFLVAAVHLDPGYSQAIYRLGLWYWRDQDYHTALLWLPQVDARDPNYPGALFLAARCAYRLGRYGRAAALDQRLAALWPLAQVLNNWALAEAQLGQLHALTLLARARRTLGADGGLQTLLAGNTAAVACQLGDRERALAVAQAAAPA
ncbi:MAG: CDC27 family protein, partial [Terriglobales bacterium]